MGRRAGAILVAGIAALAVAAAGASASTPHASTTVTLAYDQLNTRFYGEVKSARHVCVTGRKVTVYKNSMPPVKFDTAFADQDGNWFTSGSSPEPTEHFAKAKRVVVGQPGHRVVCKADTSPTVMVFP